MINANNVERQNGRYIVAGDASEPDLVLDTDGNDRTWRQEIRLPEKSPIGFVRPEIVITGAVLVMIAEWD